MRRVIIEVTQSDIDTGLRRHCNKCPVALAMRRALGKIITVGLTDAGSLGGDSIKLPPTACRFIETFDGYKSVAPFSFEVEVAL